MLLHVIVPIVLRKRFREMEKKTAPVAAKARNCGQTEAGYLLEVEPYAIMSTAGLDL
jgi:hypothetical protein